MTERLLRVIEPRAMSVADGSGRARRVEGDRSFTRSVGAAREPTSSVRRIADARIGAGRGTECRLEGAHRESALRRPPASYAAQLLPGTRRRSTAEGRKDLYAASGSGHWSDIAAACLTPLRALPSAKGRFQGTPDNRPEGRSMSGIGVRRHSPAKSERLQTVCCGHQLGSTRRSPIAARPSLAEDPRHSTSRPSASPVR